MLANLFERARLRRRGSVTVAVTSLSVPGLRRVGERAHERQPVEYRRDDPECREDDAYVLSDRYGARAIPVNIKGRRSSKTGLEAEHPVVVREILGGNLLDNVPVFHRFARLKP
jgi:hypothetical protein